MVTDMVQFSKIEPSDIQRAVEEKFGMVPGQNKDWFDVRAQRLMVAMEEGAPPRLMPEGWFITFHRVENGVMFYIPSGAGVLAADGKMRYTPLYIKEFSSESLQGLIPGRQVGACLHYYDPETGSLRVSTILGFRYYVVEEVHGGNGNAVENVGPIVCPNRYVRIELLEAFIGSGDETRDKVKKEVMSGE